MFTAEITLALSRGSMFRSHFGRPTSHRIQDKPFSVPSMAKVRALLRCLLRRLICLLRSLCWSHGPAVATGSCGPAVPSSQKIPQINFTEKQKTQFKVSVDAELEGVNPYELGKDDRKLEEYVKKAKAIVQQVVPKEVLAQIHDHVLSSDGLGLCLVKVPLEKDEDMGPTPTDGKAPKRKSTFYSEAFQVGLSEAALGLKVFTYLSEKGEQMIHTVAPVLGHEKAAANYGAEAGWGGHVERTLNRDQDDPSKPAITVLVLAVLRSDPEGKASTYVMPFDAFETLSDEHKEALSAKEFKFLPPDAYKDKGILDNFTSPVLGQDAEGQPTLCLDIKEMMPETLRAKAALEALKVSLDNHTYEVPSTPGTMLLINNVKCVHTRGTGFKVYGNGKDRWLTRIFLAKNPPARIIEDL